MLKPIQVEMGMGSTSHFATMLEVKGYSSPTLGGPLTHPCVTVLGPWIELSWYFSDHGWWSLEHVGPSFSVDADRVKIYLTETLTKKVERERERDATWARKKKKSRASNLERNGDAQGRWFPRRWQAIKSKTQVTKSTTREGIINQWRRGSSNLRPSSSC